MDAVEGIEQLILALGDGDIVARLEVDQSYAQRQHEERGWNHPRGGRAGYLGDQLIEQAEDLMGEVANSLLTRGGQIL